MEHETPVSELYQQMQVPADGESYFWRLLDTLPVAAYTCDREGLVTHFNPAAEMLWGRAPRLNDPRDRYCGSFRLYSAADGSPLAHADCWMAQALRTGKTFNREEEVIERMDGSRVTVLAHVNPIHDASGNLQGAVNVLIDIEQRRRAEEVQAQMAAIVESSDDAIISKTLDGIIVSWNRSATRLYGYSAQEAIGAPITLIVPADKREEELRILERLRRGERIDHIETVRVDKAGRRLNVSLTVSPVRDASGRIVGASKVARDITARRQTDDAILALKDQLALQLADLRRLHDMSSRLCTTLELQPILEEILRTAVAVEGTDMGLLSLWEPEANCLRVGASLGLDAEFLKQVAAIPSGVAVCGQSFQEQRCVSIDDVESDPILDPLRHAVRAAGIKSIHCTPLITRSGESVGVLVLYFRWRHKPSDREMNVIDLCARQAVDFIENARLYAELRESDRRKDEFLATLAHELRNPLAPISNALQILSMSGNLTPTVEGVRSIMERQVKHLVRLVDDLLEISRITRGRIDLRREYVPLGLIIESAVETSRPLISEARHQLTISLPADSLIVNADPVRLAQVFSNLLNNSAKYTDEGGQIWLTVRREGAEVVVTVRDNGLGIPSEMQSRVFDIFSQVDHARGRPQGGLGIGLSLAKRLVELHNGTIEMHSAGRGKGTELTVRLPLVTEAPPVAANDAVALHPSLPSRKIVIVDDTRAAAHVLCRLLQAMGQHVQTATSADAAEVLIRADLPDVVISDIAMPEVDGYELARRLRRDEQLRGITLVALTGYGQASDRKQTRAAGFDYHLVKPVSLDDLQHLLASLPVNPQTAAAN